MENHTDVANKHIELPPAASRLMTGLRDTDYQFVTAVADLVDNSISAGAGRVAISIQHEGLNSWVSIEDDGEGMDAKTLSEAMRYGSIKDADYDGEALGKFGLGLKTASLSQCRKMTVCTRSSAERRIFTVMRWDVDKVKDKWLAELLTPDDLPAHLMAGLQKHTGTVVLWENLDRVIGGYANPDGKRAKDGLLALADDLAFHLGMVFHRFLDGAVKRRRKLAITVNGNPVSPWDPFAREHKKTLHLKPESFELITPDGKRGEVTYTPFVLPTRDHLTDTEADYLGGPDKWMKQQGFYVYRNNRLIRYGGWLNMRAGDEHTKLARAAIDFPSKLDELFKINIAKERVLLPPELRDQLMPHVKLLWDRADKIYRKEGSEKTASGTSVASSAGHRAVPATSSGPILKGNTDVWAGHMEQGVSERESDFAGSQLAIADSVAPEKIRAVLERAAHATVGDGVLAALITEVKKQSSEVARALGY